MQNDPNLTAEERLAITNNRQEEKLKNFFSAAAARSGFSGMPRNREEKRRFKKNAARMAKSIPKEKATASTMEGLGVTSDE